MKNSLQQPQRQSSIGILTFLTPTKLAWPMANCRDLAFKFDELNKVYLLLGTVFVVLIIELLLI
jgi:putative membrane protein